MMRVRVFRGLVVAVLLVAAMVFGGIAALADSFVQPEPSILESEDGSAVFVFNPDMDSDYPKMGVYRNTSPTELMYPINLGTMVFEPDFYFSADMRYFVFVPTVSQDVAIEFYRDGVLIQSHRIRNLVKDRDAVTFSVSMAFWHNAGSRSFNSTDNTFTLTTVDDLTYVFDVTTGDAIVGEILEGGDDKMWSPFNIGDDVVIEPYIFDIVIDDDTVLEPHIFHIVTDDDAVPEPPILHTVTGQPLIPFEPIITTVILEDVESPDLPLIVGIIVMGVCAAGIIAAVVIHKIRKKKILRSLRSSE